MRPALVLTALIGLAMSAVLVASGDSPGLGNGVYTVFVEDQQGTDGVGTFTITTGSDHPAGEGQEILLNRDGPGDAATSYLTVRSYTTGVDYVQALGDQYSGNIVYPLDAHGITQPTSGGYVTTYAVSEFDRLTIESSIEVAGSGFDGAAALLTATVSNDSDQAVAVGLRYLLDLAPGGDDGPLLATPFDPDGRATGVTISPAPAAVNVIPNDADPDAAFAVSADGPSQELKFGAWADAFDSSFDFATDNEDVATSGGVNDSALLYYFGSDDGTTLAPGESVTVTLTIGAPVDLEAGCEPDCPTATPTPVPGTSPTPTPAVTPRELPNTGGRRR